MRWIQVNLSEKQPRGHAARSCDSIRPYKTVWIDMYVTQDQDQVSGTERVIIMEHDYITSQWIVVAVTQQFSLNRIDPDPFFSLSFSSFYYYYGFYWWLLSCQFLFHCNFNSQNAAQFHYSINAIHYLQYQLMLLLLHQSQDSILLIWFCL